MLGGPKRISNPECFVGSNDMGERTMISTRYHIVAYPVSVGTLAVTKGASTIGAFVG